MENINEHVGSIDKYDIYPRCFSLELSFSNIFTHMTEYNLGHILPNLTHTKHYRPQQHTNNLNSDDVKELLSLVSDLRGLPTDPNKDIYGLDTRISMATFDIQWDNADDGGVGEITDETKDTFKRIAESIQALARQKAKQQSRQ
jgi:hypothetical protein